MQPALQFIERDRITASEHLDAAVGQILRVPGQTQTHRFGTCGGTEEYALHATADDEALSAGSDRQVTE